MENLHGAGGTGKQFEPGAGKAFPDGNDRCSFWEVGVDQRLWVGVPFGD